LGAFFTHKSSFYRKNRYFGRNLIRIIYLLEAKKTGAQGVFDTKYKNKVLVYTIDNFSKEICTSPHVNNISELGQTREGGKIKHLTFKIIKEESSSAGVRRIKAELFQ